MAIRVLLADDHSLFRRGLRRLLDAEDDLTVVAEAGDGEELGERVANAHPDVILLSTQLDHDDGIFSPAHLQRHGKPHIVLLALYDDDDHLHEWLRGGAQGYVLKSSPSQEVIAAVRASRGMEGHRSNGTGRSLRGASPEPDKAILTDKEADVLRLVSKGMSNKQIARELAYSESTVKNRLSVIFEKMGVQDRTQAAIVAVRSGLIKREDSESG